MAEKRSQRQKFRSLKSNGQINVFTKLAEIMFNRALCCLPPFLFCWSNDSAIQPIAYLKRESSHAPEYGHDIQNIENKKLLQ